MSLTQLINSNKEVRDFFNNIKAKKKEFHTESGKEAFSKEYEEKVPYNLDNRFYSILIGTAFDFIARFEIARAIEINKDALYESLINKAGVYTDISAYYSLASAIVRNINSKSDKEYIEDYELYVKKFEVENRNCMNYIKKYINNETDDIDKIIDISIYFAKILNTNNSYISTLVLELDEPFDYFINHKESIFSELKKLLLVFRKEFMVNKVKKDSVVIFSPEFGFASEIVSGAEADIYIDGTLYDFKTTKKYTYKGEDVNQIIGYYLLNKLTQKYIYISECKLDYTRHSQLLYNVINSIAFYKARFGEVEYLDTTYFNRFDESKLIEMFEELLKNSCSRYKYVMNKYKDNYYF